MDADMPKCAESHTDDGYQCQRKEGTVNAQSLPLPLALREQEISELAFEALVRIAEDDQSPTGRLKRIPRKIPVRPRKTVNN